MNLLFRVKNILLKPRLEWDQIAIENEGMWPIYTNYIIPLALLGAMAALTGWWLVGVDAIFVKLKGLNWGIYHALDIFLGFTLTILLAIYSVDGLAPYFNSEKNLNRSAQLVCYSFTPGLVGSLLTVVPSLSFIGYLFSLYGIYLWWLGLGPLKKTSGEKQVPYLITSVILVLVYLGIIKSLLQVILRPMLGVDPLPELRLH